VFGEESPLAKDERQPRPGPVVVKRRDVECALLEQAEVGLTA
jgi:hypothetical protein